MESARTIRFPTRARSRNDSFVAFDQSHISQVHPRIVDAFLEVGNLAGWIVTLFSGVVDVQTLSVAE